MTKPCFEVFMVVVICLNLVTLMLETDSMSHQTDVILYWIHMVFILIFLTEFIVKIIALRKYYFKDCLNVLDFVVIIFSIGGEFSHGDVIVSSGDVVTLIHLDAFRFILLQGTNFVFMDLKNRLLD